MYAELLIQSEKASAEVPVRDPFPPAGRRIAELDGLRGIAILLVLMGHLFAYAMMGRSWSGLGKIVLALTGPGWLGVDIFFVLSGFLITGILLKDKETSQHYIRNFYGRRVLRILPLYAVALILVAVFYHHPGPTLVLGVLMCVNFAPIFNIEVVSGAAALWSLSVEEHFYLIWPWIVRTFRPTTLAAVCLFICAAEPAIRAITIFMVPDVYFYSWFRFDGLAWGALMAVTVHELRGRGGRRTALRFAAILCAVSIAGIVIGGPHGILHRSNRLGAAFQFTLAEMGTAGLVLALVTLSGSRIAAPFRFAPLLLFGDLSYCLYIAHMFVVDLVDRIGSHFTDIDAGMTRLPFLTVRAAIVLVATLAIAALSRRYFEQPILKLKRYFQPAH